MMRSTIGLAIALVSTVSSHAESVREQPIEKAAIATLTIPGYADFLVADGDSVWTTNEGRVERLSVGSPSPVASVSVPSPCGAMAIGFESLWVADCKSLSVYRIDLETNKVVSIINTGLADPGGELSLAVGAGSVWVLTDSKGELARVDPQSNKVAARIKVAANSYCAVFGSNSVWITNTGREGSATAGSVQRIDPSSNKVSARIPVGPEPRFLAANDAGVWTLNQGDGSVTRVDPQSNTVSATMRLGVDGEGGDIAVGKGRVWVRATKVLLTAIDTANNETSVVFGPPSGSGAVRVAGDLVWVTAHDTHKVWVIRADAP